MWNSQTQSQLHDFINHHFHTIPNYNEFYSTIDYPKLCNILNFDDVDIINLKIDDILNEMLFPNNKIDDLVFANFPSIINKVNSEIDTLQLRPFISDKALDEDYNKDPIDHREDNQRNFRNQLTEPLSEPSNMHRNPSLPLPQPTSNSSFRNRSLSLDLMRSKSRNLSQPSKPAAIDATMVNVNVQPTKITLLPTSETSKRFLFTFNKQNKSFEQNQLPGTLPKQRDNRRNSMLVDSLPTYVLDQIRNPDRDGSLSGEPAHDVVKKLSESVVNLNVASQKKNSQINWKNTKAKEVDDSQVLKPSAIDDEEISTLNKNQNNTRFHNVLSNSQHLYSHSNDLNPDKIDKINDSPITLSERAETIQEDLTEEEYVLPNLVTKYYQIDVEDSHEREEFLRALDADEETDFVNLNDSNEDIKDDNATIEDEYLF